MPSYLGITNSRSLAVLGAMLANGGIYKGRRIISEHMLQLAESFDTEHHELDLVLGTDRIRFTTGGWSPDIARLPSDLVGKFHFVGWAGLGGSVLVWDREHRVSFHHVMNTLSGRGGRRVRATCCTRRCGVC